MFLWTQKENKIRLEKIFLFTKTKQNFLNRKLKTTHTEDFQGSSAVANTGYVGQEQQE